MALSKDWTLADAIGFIRVIVDEISGIDVPGEQIIDSIHLAVCEVAQLLAELKKYDYGQTTTLTITSNAADISAHNVQNIVKIVDATNGLCYYRKPDQFDGLRFSPQNRNNVYWTRNGNVISFYKGTISAYGTTTMHFTRYPTKATSLADYLDIKDPFVWMALDKARNHTYQQLKIKAPLTFEQQINNSINLIKKAYSEEMQVRLGPKARK